MRGTTHIAAGSVAALYLATSPVQGAAMIAGSLLPDIDVGSSKLGRYNPLSFVIPHRGVTHSLLAVGLIYWLYEPLAIGMMTHVILDMLNPRGVSLLWPLPFKVKLPIIGNIESGGILDALIMVLMLVFIIYRLVLDSSGSW